MRNYTGDLESVDCNRRICRDIPPPSRGIFVNVVRSDSEPYIRGDAIIDKRERVHSLCLPTVEPAVRYFSSLSRHRVRRFTIYCTAGECGEHFPNIGAHRGAPKDHLRWLERELAPQDLGQSPPGGEGREGPCGARMRPWRGKAGKRAAGSQPGTFSRRRPGTTHGRARAPDTVDAAAEPSAGARPNRCRLRRQPRGSSDCSAGS